MGLCFLIFLITTLTSPTIAAGASGAVSVSIRVEVGLADLQRGGTFNNLRGAAGAEGALVEIAPRLRHSLNGRYLPSEIDRIVSSVTEHVVIVMDGEAFTNNTSNSTWLTSDNGNVFSL